ncbi:MAG: TolC family protein [Phycisphaerae bacterium]|nr:TolC family protein [Phycisphaerae bacterium]
MYRATIIVFFLAAGLIGGCARSEAVRRSALRPDEHPASEPMPWQTHDEPQPTGVITLHEAAALALAGHPRLRVFAFEMQAADARTLQAGLRANPELGVEVESLAGRGERSGIDAAETTIQLGQLIELGGKRDKRLRAASLAEELTEWDYESQRLDVLKEVADAFVAVLAAQERVSLAEQLGRLARQAEAAVAQRVEAGRDSPVQSLRAGVLSSQSRIEIRKATSALATARLRLAATWGATEAAFEAAAGDFHAVEPAPPLNEVSDALAANPDLARWAVEQRQRRAALDLEKARAKVDVTVAAGVQRYEETDDAAFVVGLALPIPILDRNQGGIAEATANLAKARQESEAARVETLAALSAAVNALASAYDEVRVLQSEVLPQAEQAFEAVQQGYREGKFDYLYVVDTQRTLFETKAQHIDAVEAYHRARRDVERLIGQPLETFKRADGANVKGTER